MIVLPALILLLLAPQDIAKIDPHAGDKPVRFTATGTYSDGASRVFLVSTDLDSDNDGVSDIMELRVGCSNGAVSSAIVSPRDPASGLPTGKRMHKPMTVTKELGRADGGIMASDDWQTRVVGKPIAATWDLATAKGGRSSAPPASGKPVALVDVDPAVCAR